MNSKNIIGLVALVVVLVVSCSKTSDDDGLAHGGAGTAGSASDGGAAKAGAATGRFGGGRGQERQRR
jgi:hypothetical protein